MRPNTALESFEQTLLGGAASWERRHRQITGRMNWPTPTNNERRKRGTGWQETAVVLAPSTEHLRQSPKSCQVLKHHGDFQNSIFGSFSFASGFSVLGGHFSRLTSVITLRLRGTHRTAGAGAVTVACWQAPPRWEQRRAALGDVVSSRNGAGDIAKEGNGEGEKPEDLTEENRELVGSIEERLSTCRAAGAVAVVSPTCEN